MTLPKSSSFNKIVTLDLKEFGSKYILWMVDSFIRFIQGKLIPNKNAVTIISTLMDMYCMNLGFATKRFFADNSGKFANVKLSELNCKLGLTVMFGPAISPWSNGINERNHTFADITIRKLMEEKKVPLSDSLVKAAACTHNMLVNKLGYSPLKLVTGKAVSIPGLTTGDLASESMSDSEAVRRTMENLTRIISVFREADMCQKLKDSQGYRTQAYQHLGQYLKGDLVWFRHLNENAWLGPAAVLCTEDRVSGFIQMVMSRR